MTSDTLAGLLSHMEQVLHNDDLAESEADPAGIRCDTEWCNAFDDPRAECGDHRGRYAGLVHKNRARRAEARDRGEPFESGCLLAGEEE